jgi:hypothetical protein
MCLYRAEHSHWAEYTSKDKGKGHLRTGHENPEVEERYSSTLSFTSAIDGVGGQRRYTLYRRLGGS